MSTTQSRAQLLESVLLVAGGTVVGRTRLQKLVYLLELAGFDTGFPFFYKHYGPFSEELVSALDELKVLGRIEESEVPTSWGGWYSKFSICRADASQQGDSRMAAVVKLAGGVSAIVLELAATAAFLSAEYGCVGAWDETRRRKPDKATAEGLKAAKDFFRDLQNLNLPKKLPDLAS